MRILAISSQVAYGPVGLTAAAPPLQAGGHEVMAVPTITLSNHPGHAAPAGFRTLPEDLGKILAALESLGALKDAGAALTGYFASPEQVEAAAFILARMKSANPSLVILVDPVIGDGAALYVPEAVAVAIRDRLVPLATAITPNRFELAWLSGHEVTDEASAIAAARALGTPEVLATSIPQGTDHLATVLITPDAHHAIVSPKLAQVPHGTGDMLSGLYLSYRMSSGPETALGQSMAMLTRAIAISKGTPVLDVAGALFGR